MKQGMTNVDVAALAAELAPLLVGGRLEKAYQPAKEQVLLRLRRKGVGRIDLLFELGRFLTVTQRPPENPDKPSMVAQVLRQQLENARVAGLAQVGFDRLLRIDLERGDGRRSLVFELFGDGNLLLLDA
ncbi:MAG TPA: NFACT family protein, partial [Candidatus Thermoplasmatota archaeon]|nr:NFACT family protein [Candidatus Thermoplasmatota archaeon]